MRVIQRGHTGPSVHDIQRRLDELGRVVAPDPPGEFAAGTYAAVRGFQQSRGLSADGIVGRDTWRSLVEAGYSLGDRLLYLTRPTRRGDDVRDLQERLNRLGFDTGQVDGIFGPETRDAVVDFQANAGLLDDGTAGPATIDALRRLHRSHQAVAASVVRERHQKRPGSRTSVTGVPLLIDPAHGPENPGYQSMEGVAEHEVTWIIANRLHGRLAALGARPVLARGPATTPTTSQRAAQANRENVDAVVSLHCNGLPGSRAARGVSAAYFGHGSSVSEHGRRLAELSVQRISDVTGSPDCRAHPSTAALLRETRAVAVIVELGFLTHEHEGHLLADPDHQGVLAACLADAVGAYLLE